MKPFTLFKIPVFLLGFGALLLVAPSCKAQSDVSPDHFDGTDAWEVTARKPVAPKTKVTLTAVSRQAQNEKAGTGASLQLASARDFSSSSQKAAVVQDKRKTAVRKPDNKEQ